jgi:glycosyltransferase involved in cell wall biosynthesis
MTTPTFAMVSVADPAAVSTWSGIPYHIMAALRSAGAEVNPVGPLPAVEPWYYSWLRRFYWRMGFGWFYAEVEPVMLQQRAKVLRALLQSTPHDILLSIHPEPLAYRCTDKPSVLIHDCTFQLLLGYYGTFSRLSHRSARLGHKLYHEALARCSGAVFSSQWAASSAITDYGACPDKVNVVEFGANLGHMPSDAEVETLILQRSGAEEMRLLLLGVDWERKGGNDAWRIISLLRDAGVPAFLDVVGCEPPNDIRNSPFCRSHGFLRKDLPVDREHLQNILQQTHFLLVPSLAECYGCVYCEAAAYGIPSIGRDTGGVSQIIRHNINGFLLSSASGNLKDITAILISLWNNRASYSELARHSREDSVARLNWDRFAAQLLSRWP